MKILLAIFLLAFEVGLPTALAAQASPAPPASVQGGKVTEISGAVTVTRAGKTSEIPLKVGTVDFTPTGGAAEPTKSGPAPAEIKVGATGSWVLTFTQDQYNAIEAQLFPAVPTA